MQKRQFITMLSGAMLTGVSGLVRAQGAGTPGVTDREIKIGSTGPLSGPAAGYGIVGKTMSAWFDLVNAEGGVNGRQLKLVLADDGYSPPKTLEQVRRLVEREQVAFIAGQIGSSALLQRLAAVRGRLSLCADQAAAAKWWLSMPMASVSAEGPMPKALSTRRTSPLMPGCRHQGRACPLRRARMTSNPLIVA